MTIRKNIILQFTIITFVVIVGVSSYLATLLTDRMTERVIHHHLDFYPRLATRLINNDPDVYKIFKKDIPKELKQQICSRFREFLHFGTIFRTKVWTLDGTVLWSDEPEIIGKKYDKKEDFTKVIKGGVQYEIESPHETEHEYELHTKKFLEIYIPVSFKNEVIGVIEVYEKTDQLFENIRRDTSIIWLLVGIAGLVIYLLLFFVFLKAHQRQKKISRHLLDTQQAVITSLAYQAEIRDVETGRHLERTTEYVRILAEDLRNQPPKYTLRESDKNYLTDEYISDLIKSIPLHDIGKVGVPDAILCKPSKLTDEEFNLMKKHCEYGASILRHAEGQLTFRSFLHIGIQLALSHHEHWDGKGYPAGLKGEEIPLSARIMAVADVYDALRSSRCYKKAFSHEKSVEIIREGRDTQFDSFIVDAFLNRESEFERISIELSD